MRSCLSREKNTRDAIEQIDAAADDGADYILTPEMTNIVDRNPARMAEAMPVGEILEEIDLFAEAARRNKCWLHIGSMAIRVNETKFANRAFLFSPDGEIKARYDKIHMFDVALSDGETWRESRVYDRGDEAVMKDLGVFKLGFAICYDLRFPSLFRLLANAGAEVIAAPAAFTRQTGKAHWRTLLRARAIECGAFVIAAAQGGRHEDERETFGHSMIIGPWGDVKAELDTDAPGIVMADIDIAEVHKARRQIPNLSLEHSPKLTKLGL